MGDEKLVAAVLEDWKSAPVSEPIRLVLGFLEKLTLTPGDVGAIDIAPLRAAGISDKAIEDAIHVAVLFNIYDRMADALNFDVPGPASFAHSAKMLLRRGYL